MVCSKEYYALSLWDYSLPGFCSGIANYYGTMDDISRFIERLSRKETSGFDDTISAFARYKNGEETATHNVAYNQCRLLTPVRLIAEKHMLLPVCEWTYRNTYGMPYYLKCDGGSIDRIVVKKENQYLRCLRGELDNLYYASDLHRCWQPLENGFWGHPCMIEHEKQTDSLFQLRYALFVEAAAFDGEDQALRGFDDDSVPDLSVLGKDLFGDG